MYWGQAGMGVAAMYWVLPLLFPLNGDLGSIPVDVDALLALGLLSGSAACSLIGLWRRSLYEKISGGIGLFLSSAGIVSLMLT
jgi:hypothetical protein